jgi:hypothetical protein
MMARSFEYVCGIAVFEGKNSTVSTIRVPFFLLCELGNICSGPKLDLSSSHPLHDDPMRPVGLVSHVQLRGFQGAPRASC